MGTYKAKYKTGASVKNGVTIFWETATQEELAYAYEELGMTGAIEKFQTLKQKMSQRKVKSQTRTSAKSKTNTFEFGVFNLSTPQHIEEPLDLKRVHTDYIPFGQNNLFPQYLAELKRKSSTHRSVLAQKLYLQVVLSLLQKTKS